MSTKRIVSLILILIPVVAFAESLVYIQKAPTASTTKMQGPSAYVPVAGIKVDQPIAITVDGTPVWAVLVSDADLAKVSKDAAYLGKGLNEVKAKDKAIYDKLTVKRVTLDNGSTVTLQSDALVPVGATVKETDIPIQTFAGFDALTGDASGITIKEVAPKEIVK